MGDTNWSHKERCATDDMSRVSAGVPVIFLFPTRSFNEFEKKNCSSKTIGFFSNKLSLELGISPCFFHRLFYPFREHQFGKNSFHLRWQRLPSLRNYIFKRRNLFIKYVSKYKNRLYTSKYNWKDLKELFPSETLRPLRDDDFTEDLTQGEKFFGIFYNIFRGNSGKNFNFHFNNIIFIHVWLNYCEKAINTSKQSFHIRSFIVSYNVCPVAIPETCAKTQRSDYWQLIHCFCVCICAGIRLLLLGTGKSKHERYANL